MSEPYLGRALEFMSQPQDVEVLRGGNWVLGWMVGWRQEEGSSCRVMVRVTERGAAKTAWADLHDVRLPQYRGCPPTQSLPLLPRLPPGRMEQMTWSGSGSEWDDQQSLRDSPEPAPFHAHDADAATGQTSSGAGWGNLPASGRPRSRHGHDAGASLPSWWPSSAGPVAPPEGEPTQLLTSAGPRHRETVAARHSGFTAS